MKTRRTPLLFAAALALSGLTFNAAAGQGNNVTCSTDASCCNSETKTSVTKHHSIGNGGTVAAPKWTENTARPTQVVVASTTWNQQTTAGNGGVIASPRAQENQHTTRQYRIAPLK